MEDQGTNDEQHFTNSERQQVEMDEVEVDTNDSNPPSSDEEQMKK